MNFHNVCIEAIGYCLPSIVMTSEKLEKMLAPLYERLGLSEGRLELMSGIRQRRFWPEGTLPSQASAMAAQNTLEKAGLEAGDIDCLINCSVSRDFVEPATSTAVHRLLKLGKNVLNFDISNACLGMASGVMMLANMVELGQIRRGIAVCGENSWPLVKNTLARLNEDMSMTRQRFKGQFASLTIGSAAAAVVVSAKGISRFCHKLLGMASVSDSSANDLCQGDANGGMTEESTPVMDTDSQTLLKRGVDVATLMWRRLKETVQWNESTPDVICTHQVGKAHSALLFDTLGLNPEHDFVSYPELGNCGSASWPVTCAMAEERGVLRAGHHLAVLGIGSGINCTGMAIDW